MLLDSEEMPLARPERRSRGKISLFSFSLQGAFRDAPRVSSGRERSAVATMVSCSNCLGVVAQRRVQIMFVVVGDPGFQGADELKGATPFREPEALFFECAHHALSISITFRVVIAGKRLMNLQCIASPHKSERGRLTPVVTPQGDALPPCATRALTVDGHIQRHQSMSGCARALSIN